MYQEVEKKLNEEKFSRKLRSLYKTDVSKQFEDVVGDLYIHCIENSITNLTDEEVFKFFKDYHREARKNSHTQIVEEITEKAEEIYFEFEDKDYFEDRCKNINLTEEEILCLLYARSKKYKKILNYDFISRVDGTGIDKNKLCNYYETIVLKLVEYIGKELKNSV